MFFGTELHVTVGKKNNIMPLEEADSFTSAGALEHARFQEKNELLGAPTHPAAAGGEGRGLIVHD